MHPARKKLVIATSFFVLPRRLAGCNRPADR